MDTLQHENLTSGLYSSRRGMNKGNHCCDCGATIWTGSTRCRPCKTSNSRNSANSFVCEQCGKESHRRPGGRTVEIGAKNRWCSAACMKAWYEAHQPEPLAPFSPVRFNTCKQCGKQWVAKRVTSLCSDECGREYARVAALASYAAEVASRELRPCAECGRLFVPMARIKFCSDRCMKINHCASGVRYTKKKYGMTVSEWQRLRRAVLRRDGYRCYICGGLTDTTADVNGDRYPNADHVVEISEGGTTTMDNLRCACRSCNMLKQKNKRVGGQHPYILAE